MSLSLAGCWFEDSESNGDGGSSDKPSPHEIYTTPLQAIDLGRGGNAVNGEGTKQGEIAP